MSVAAANIELGDGWAVQLAESQTHCQELSKEQARNFYYGMKLVPEPKRSAMFALYAWMRMADDITDAAGETEAKEEALGVFLETTARAVDPQLSNLSDLPRGRVWPAVREMFLRYQMPMEYFRDMIEGQLMDRPPVRYKNFDQLYDYCYKVASVVGLACIQIWGYDGGAETRQMAEWRGIAFQLTNICRDVMEDVGRDRVYLPAQDFNVHELNPTMFELGRRDEILPGLKKVLQRAESYYEKSAPLDGRVHRDGRACLWAMTEIYHRLLKKIAARPEAVLDGKRVRLSAFRKGWIALRASLPGAGG
ncbi:MAG: phytoene/squalene synthase family protein [Phycisphaeraceae bacterium]|nr:phytoene/squalene synthase family protein [Phycisphaeraceae bacterium]